MRKLCLGLTSEEERALDVFASQFDKPPYSVSINALYAFLYKEHKKNGLFSNCVIQMDRTDGKAAFMVQRIIGW